MKAVSWAAEMAVPWAGEKETSTVVQMAETTADKSETLQAVPTVDLRGSRLAVSRVRNLGWNLVVEMAGRRAATRVGYWDLDSVDNLDAPSAAQRAAHWGCSRVAPTAALLVASMAEATAEK